MDQQEQANAKKGPLDKVRLARGANICARIAVAIVFFFNVQCALSFVLQPSDFASGFELSGVAGNVAVQGLGVAFLMWNATYPAVIVNPRRFRLLYLVVLVQQTVGLVGESLIRASLPSGHSALVESINRFVAFDAFGLVIMTAAFVALAVLDKREQKQTA